jgi:arylsulfatase A-like enzyme
MGGAIGAASLSPLLPLGGCSRGQRPGDLPNVIVIMTDDQGYQDLGCYGSPDISTPRIDRMAAEGIRFTDFYAAPQCTAARIAMMTGCYAHRAGDLKRTGVGSHVGIHDEEVTVAELFKTRGYSTHLVGKWHLGMAPAFSPLRHGFDSFFGMLTSNGQFPPLMRGTQVTDAEPDQSQLTEIYTREALSVIAQSRDEPFFLLLAHAMPHVPLSVPASWRGRSRRGLYGDAVELIDWSTGQVLDLLVETGLDEQTLVIFCSDNGPWLIKGKNGGSALPLRGGKGQIFEGGLRVPCIMRWPAHIPPGRVNREVCGLLDFLPTFAQLAGAELPVDRVIDGRDIAPLLFDRPGATSPHDAYYFFKGSELRAVRQGRWKYHAPHSPRSPNGNLYDLFDDIAEKNDLVDQHSEIALELQETMNAFAADLEQTKREPGRVEA